MKKNKKKLKEITKEEYQKIFISSKKYTEIKDAYDKAWAAKNFEIENYWKRATYFWAFQVASFAGYFSVYNSKIYSNNTEILYCVICIGFVTALAWLLINRGSKDWQKNWENHVDLLEDYITGPLYKTVFIETTFSVSKINEIVSFFINGIWIILAIKYLMENITFHPCYNNGFNFTVLSCTILVIAVSIVMIFGYGRSNLKINKLKIFSRENYK